MVLNLTRSHWGCVFTHLRSRAKPFPCVPKSPSAVRRPHGPKKPFSGNAANNGHLLGTRLLSRLLSSGLHLFQSQFNQYPAKGTLGYERGHTTLPTTQVCSCLEYNHLFLFTVMTEECAGAFTHRYKNLFIYRVTRILNWEMVLFS